MLPKDSEIDVGQDMAKFITDLLTYPYIRHTPPVMVDCTAAEILGRAEREVRVLIAEAASAGQYDVVSRLTDVARRVADILDPSSAAKSASLPEGLSSETRHSQTEGRQTRAKPRKSSGKPGYPRFERRRDTLVKIGWSEKDRREYVHKTPRAGVDAVARRVAELGDGGRMFTTEELLPVKLGGSGKDLSGYQAYICLAWLVKIGVVQRHGREGYSMSGAGTESRVASAWESLPESGGRTGR